MKTIKILFLSMLLVLNSYSSQDEQTLYFYESDGKADSAFCISSLDVGTVGRYGCVDGKKVRRKIVLEKAKIELEESVTGYEYVADKNLRKKDVLINEKIRDFLNDINKFTLFIGNMYAFFCFEIHIYENDSLIINFETNGSLFYDRKNNLLYKTEIKNQQFLYKHWEVWPENHCR